jgi:hypothetical protein
MPEAVTIPRPAYILPAIDTGSRTDALSSMVHMQLRELESKEGG